MSGFFDLLQGYGRFWPYAVAGLIGVGLRAVDRSAFKRPVFAGVLVAVAIGGLIGMNASPFTFGGGDHYFQSLIAMAFALAALLGYGLAAATGLIFRGRAT